MSSGKRICIIGAGPGGMSVLYQLKQLENRNDAIGAEVVCFEQQPVPGGVWTYDRGGGPMYENMWINVCKESKEYADYSYDGHFGRRMPSYFTREVQLDYLVGRYRSAGSPDEWVRYSTRVETVGFDEKEAEFRVTSVNLETEQRDTERFDWVIVATGHFSVPNEPQLPGVETFPGRAIHAKDFVNADRFEGRDVLLVGNSFTALDVAIQCCKFGVRSVRIAYRTAPLNLGWPDNVKEVPMVERVRGRTVVFGDGSSSRFDDIVLCTGYLHSFPFMEENLRLVTDNVLCPDRLYKGVQFTGAGSNRLFYVGMQSLIYSFTMLDLQAVWIIKSIKGELQTPAPDRVRDHCKVWMGKEASCGDLLEKLDLQTEYLEDLKADVGCEWNIDCRIMLKKWMEQTYDNVLANRDHTFVSLVTGEESAQLEEPFLSAKKDPFLGLLATE